MFPKASTQFLSHSRGSKIEQNNYERTKKGKVRARLVFQIHSSGEYSPENKGVAPGVQLHAGKKGKLASQVRIWQWLMDVGFMQDSVTQARSLSIKMTGCWAVKDCSVMSDSVTPWTVAHQAPLFMGFSRQKYWRSLLFPSPGDLPDPGIEPASPTSSASQADSLLLSHQGSPSKGFGYQEVKSRGKASDCELGVLCRLSAKHKDRPQNASQPQIQVNNKSKYAASVDTKETNKKLGLN